MVNIELIKELDCTDLKSVKPYAFYLCKNFLGKAWSKYGIEDFDIIKMNGGLENFTYICKIVNKDAKPDQILNLILKIHGDVKRNDIEMIMKDNIVSSFISNLKQGPHLYGIFSMGRIEQYFDCRTLTHSEMISTEYSAPVAKELAIFHALQIPLVRNPDIMFTNLTNKLDKIMCQSFDDHEHNENHKQFLKFGIEKELNQLIPFLRNLNSPLVYSHNDVCFNNVLKISDEKLMLIDYEESSYGYRGTDIGAYFSSFMFNSAHDQFPYFKYDLEAFPTTDEQLVFVESYIRECKSNELYKKNIEDSGEDLTAEKLMFEARAFALFYNLSSAIWAKEFVGKSEKKFSFKDWAIKRCEAYFHLKNVFFKDIFD